MTAVDINPEFSESDWIESESIRRLMQPRSTMMSFATLTMLVMAIQLYGHLNTYLVGSWLVVSLVFTVFRFQIKKLFNQKIAALNVTSQSAFIKRYSIVWSLTALVWGIAGWLSFANLPIQNLYICASILNLVVFIGVLNIPQMMTKLIK